MHPILQVFFFDGLRLECRGRVVRHFRTQKTATLFAYLAYRPGRLHQREALIELFWPEYPLEAGRDSLNTALSSIRRELAGLEMEAGEVLLADRAAIEILADRLTTDVREFERAMEAAGRAEAAERAGYLEEAVRLYRGEFLRGCYEDWVFPEQTRLAAAFRGALRELVSLHEERGDLQSALRYANVAVGSDPLCEESRLALMRLYGKDGQAPVALDHFRELSRLLRQELDRGPGEAVRALASALSRQQAGRGVSSGEPPRPDTPRDTGSPGTPGEPPGNGPTGGAVPPASGPRRAAELPGPEPQDRQSGHTPKPRWNPASPPRGELPPVGGALPLDSEFYVTRAADAEFSQALARRDSIVLVKGPRQVGKTSLLARGLQQAREAGARVALTDMQLLANADLASGATFFHTLGRILEEELAPTAPLEDFWNPEDGPTLNLRRWLRRGILETEATPVVWGLDEVDRLFHLPFGGELFAVFRAWHNERALNPGGPWTRLTLALGYTTEAYLFIRDPNQSPFNVGTRLSLGDFSPAEVADLNGRHGRPLRNAEELDRFYALVGGQPYLVQLGLRELAARGLRMAALETEAELDIGLYADHLRHLLELLLGEPELVQVMRGVLQGRPCPDLNSFYRLRSAGLLAGEAAAQPWVRCRLYAVYLQRHLPSGGDAAP